MPDWLRQPPATGNLGVIERAPAARSNVSERQAPTPAPNVVDVRTFLSADDLPEWVRRLGAENEPPPPIPDTKPPPERTATREPDNPLFPRRLVAERMAGHEERFSDTETVPTRASTATDANPQAGTRQPLSLAGPPAVAPRGPRLVWPLLLFGVAAAVLIVAFLYF